MLDDRKAEILRALVEEHIRTGEPVSSRMVLEASRLPVSSATIRNELAALEREGYVVQPHTSAGRVPTDRAYRYYVDHLRPKPLPGRARERVHGFFDAMHHELSGLLRSTSELLAELTSYPAVVVGPGRRHDEQETIRAVHLLPIGDRAAMVIVVTDAGRVTKEVARLAEPISPSVLAAAEEHLARRLVGRPVEGAEAGGDVDLSPRLRAVVDAALDAIARSATDAREIYIGGTSQLAALWEDLDKVHRVLEMLERETALLGLLSAGTEGLSIRIGHELPLRDEVDLAVVSSPYGDASTAGSLGVLGPMRMDYRRAMAAVAEISEGLAESLGLLRRAGGDEEGA